jgi:hypothetical protein
MTWFGSFIKATDLACLISVLAMLWLYMRALAALRGDENQGFARNLCLGIVVGWAGTAVLYGNLVVVYWAREIAPTISPAAPAIRATYVCLTLLGCSMHIATSLATGGRWWGTLALLVLAQAVFVLAVMSLDLRGLV